MKLLQHMRSPRITSGCPALRKAHSTTALLQQIIFWGFAAAQNKRGSALSHGLALHVPLEADPMDLCLTERVSRIHFWSLLTSDIC